MQQRSAGPISSSVCVCTIFSSSGAISSCQEQPEAYECVLWDSHLLFVERTTVPSLFRDDLLMSNPGSTWRAPVPHHQPESVLSSSHRVLAELLVTTSRHSPHFNVESTTRRPPLSFDYYCHCGLGEVDVVAGRLMGTVAHSPRVQAGLRTDVWAGRARYQVVED